MIRCSILILLLLVLAVPVAELSAEVSGTVGLGYIYTDEEGNESVYQPTFNLYEGPIVNLSDFRYRFTDGTRFNADIKNISLKNRNVRAGITKSGLFGLNLAHSQYRRVYSFGEEHSVRRDRSIGDAWVKPLPYWKVYGGYGRTARKGSMVDWIDPGRTVFPRDLEHTYQHYHAGTQLNYKGTMVQGEFRGADYSDDNDASFDRKSTRYRVVAVTPLPRFRNVHLQGGFQRFEHKIDSSGRMLEANTVWGGGRVSMRGGWSVKYSFIWDRTTNEGDVVATDNIVNAAYITKTWQGLAQATIGVLHGINDDYYDEIETGAIYFAGSIKPSDVVSFRGEFGLSQDEVTDGQTLTGDEDHTRYKLTANYSRPRSSARLTYESKMRENKDLGSKADFRRGAADLWCNQMKLATLHASYALSQGEYENPTDNFEFTDHVLAGGITVPLFTGFEAVFDGTYYRSKRDLDVESTAARIAARFWTGTPRYTLEVAYAAHNFDDVLVFDGYYTANIVEIMLSRDL